MPAVATATLARMSTPSMPRNWKASGGAMPRFSCAPSKIGSSQVSMSPAPNGSPRTMPRKIEGIASRTSGMVIQRDDSWILRLDSRVDVTRAIERLAHQPEHVEGGQEGDEERRSAR